MVQLIKYALSADQLKALRENNARRLLAARE
jgi:hypothetical protein